MSRSGGVAQSEIQWGLAPSGQVPPPNQADVVIARQPYDNRNNFTAKALIPSETYAFRVRDFDVPGLIATQWSSWTVLTTTATDQVQLAFDDTVIGGATLQSDGTFADPSFQIPTNAQPGLHQISAIMAGQQMAPPVTITVIAEGQELGRSLYVIDAQNNAYNGVSGVEATYTVNLRGSGFKPGMVELFIDTASGTSLGSAFVKTATSIFFAAPVWPEGAVGPHNILAQQGANNRGRRRCESAAVRTLGMTSAWQGAHERLPDVYRHRIQSRDDLRRYAAVTMSDRLTGRLVYLPRARLHVNERNTGQETSVRQNSR